MLRKVHLHGHLAKYGPVVELDVTTAAEALRALNANFPGFYKDLEIGSYEVVRGDEIDGHRLDVEDVTAFKLGLAPDLHFIPVAEGSKRRGLLKGILGVVLVGAALFFSGGALAAPIFGSGILGGVTWGTVAVIGLGMALSGASQMLTKTEKSNKDEKAKDDSYALSGAMNTYEQGNPVPLVYGEVITGAHTISAGLDIIQLKNQVGG